MKENLTLKITAISMLVLFLFPPYIVEHPYRHSIVSAGRCFILSTPSYTKQGGYTLYGHINSIDMLVQVVAIGVIGVFIHRFVLNKLSNN